LYLPGPITSEKRIGNLISGATGRSTCLDRKTNPRKDNKMVPNNKINNNHLSKTKIIILLILLICLPNTYCKNIIYLNEYDSVYNDSVVDNITSFSKDCDDIIEGEVVKLVVKNKLPEMILREYSVRITDQHKGKINSSIIKVIIYGGEYNGYAIRVLDAPTLTVNEKVLLFLDELKDKGGYIIHEWKYGKFQCLQEKNEKYIVYDLNRIHVTNYEKEIKYSHKLVKIKYKNVIDLIRKGIRNEK